MCVRQQRLSLHRLSLFSDDENNLDLNATLGPGAQTKTNWFGFLPIPMEGTDSNLPRFEFSQEDHNQFTNLSVPTSFAKGSGIKCREGTSAKFLSRKGGISNSRRLWRCQITNQSPLGRLTLTIDVLSSDARRCCERKATSRKQDDKIWSATDLSCRND